MSKAAILIVEDEPLIADDIAGMLEKNNYAVVGIVDEARSALKLVAKERPDMVLLDINIEGDKDGIELAAELDIPFIFLTSYYNQETLDRARLTKPSGYIVKPFNEQDLIANIEMARFRFGGSPHAARSDKFFVRRDQEILPLEPDQILFVEAFDNYANLFTAEDKYIISHTLKSIEAKLKAHGFVRIHRSYLINFEAIDTISENYIFIRGHELPIGKSYRKAFFEQLEML